MAIFEEKDLDSTVDVRKGRDIFDGMLISQYASSDNLKAYCYAFFEEMDFLFEHIERVYLGRFLEYAEGAQLAIIGDIVGMSSNFGILTTTFGFLNSPNSGTYGTSSDASAGAIWNSRTPSYDPVVLTEGEYRRAVRAKAMCNGAKVQSVDFVYDVISVLLGGVPSVMSLEADTDPNNPSLIILTLEDAVTNSADVALIDSMRRYFMPVGYTLLVKLI